MANEFEVQDLSEKTVSAVAQKQAMVCVTRADGSKCDALRVWKEGCESSEIFIVAEGETLSIERESDGIVSPTSPVLNWVAKPCSSSKQAIDTCWLPDQYAIQWSWAGNGTLTSYDTLTGEVTNHGVTYYNGSRVGGYALAFKNDATEPTLFFQVGGKLYKASPDDPINTFSLVGNTTNAPSSYPCFDYIAGKLTLGDGNKAWTVDESTGAGTFIGNLIDVRDGANLSVSPGDWFSDPNGKWFMMARDNRGASFLDQDGNAYCTGTCVWEVDPVTLETTRISKTCAPTSGTGASWLSSSQFLLSTGGGDVYEWNRYTEEWSVNYDANATINDLAPQWIIPDPIRVSGWIDTDCQENCIPVLFTIKQEEDFTLTCERFEPTTGGKLGVCEKEPNPFVQDPFSPSDSSSSGCPTCPDENWHKGCSDSGVTWWRAFYPENATEPSYQYIFGTNDEPVGAKPAGFTFLECGEEPEPAPFNEVCDEDSQTTLFYERLTDGSTRFFDESGTVPEPANWTPNGCVGGDPLVDVSTQQVWIDCVPFVRKQTDTFVEPAGGGVPELSTQQVIFYNSDGTEYDSGVIPVGGVFPPANEPDYELVSCEPNCVREWYEDRCEQDDEKLLLIDSRGAFAEYSFYEGTLTDINTLSVPSAGGSANWDEFVLYSFVAASDSSSGNDSIYVTDVNTKQVSQVLDLTSADGSPTSFSAAAYDYQDGFLYSHDNSNIYRTDLNTGNVSLVTPLSGVSGSGTSMAIDADGRMIVMGSAGRVYEVDRATGAATLIYDSPRNVGNGATFGANGLLYITSGNNTVEVNLTTQQETLIIDDWAAGANSIAWYRTKAATPSCFMRRYCEDADGNLTVTGDFFLGGGERIISGAVGCCSESSTSGSSTSGGTQPVAVTNFPDEKKSLSEIRVCIDGSIDGVRKTVIDGDGNETVIFLDEDGSEVTPTSWAWDACPVVETDNEAPAISETPICIGRNGSGIRKTVIDAQGVEVVVFQDETGVIPEPAQWRFGNCDCETFDYYELSANTQEGVNVSRWLDTAIEGAGEVPVFDVFNESDSEGYPKHPNAPDSQSVSPDFNIITSQVGSSTQTMVDGYIHLTEAGYLRDLNGSHERGVVMLGECCGDLSVVGGEWEVATPYAWLDGEKLAVNAGTYRIRVYLHDDAGTNSGIQLQFSSDESSWTYLGGKTFQTCPVWECKQGYLCDETRFNEDGTPLTLSETVVLCKPECKPSTSKAKPLHPFSVSRCVQSATGGIKAERWLANNAGASLPFEDVFTETGFDGLPTRNVAASNTGVDNLRIDNTWVGTNAAGSYNEDIATGYILIPEGSTVTLRVDGGSTDHARIYLGDSPSNAKKVYEQFDSNNTDIDFAEFVGKGCKSVFIKVYVWEQAADNSEIDITWSVDGDAFTQIPNSNLSTTPFACETSLKWVEEGSEPEVDAGEFLGECQCCGSTASSGSTESVQVDNAEYDTTFDSESFTGISVPSAPTNTKEAVVMNGTNAWLEVETNYGTQVVPPSSSTSFAVNDYEGQLIFIGVSIIAGNLNPNERWAVNYRTATEA